MVVLDRDTYFTRLNTFLEGNHSDEGIQFLEDMTDTYNDMNARIEGGSTDWEQRYHELDEEWKERYKKRFFAGGTNNPNVRDNPNSDDKEDVYDPDAVRVENLFK